MLSRIVLIVVHASISERPRLDFSQEQDIQFLERPVFRLWQSEVRPDGGDQAQCTPEERSLALPIPLRRVNHVGFQDATDDVSNVIGASAEHDRLGTKPSGANFSDDGVHDRPDGHGVNSEPNKTERGLHVFDTG